MWAVLEGEMSRGVPQSLIAGTHYTYTYTHGGLVGCITISDCTFSHVCPQALPGAWMPCRASGPRQGHPGPGKGPVQYHGF